MLIEVYVVNKTSAIAICILIYFPLLSLVFNQLSFAFWQKFGKAVSEKVRLKLRNKIFVKKIRVRNKAIA